MHHKQQCLAAWIKLTDRCNRHVAEASLHQMGTQIFRVFFFFFLIYKKKKLLLLLYF
jgi:hypothetical protein